MTAVTNYNSAGINPFPSQSGLTPESMLMFLSTKMSDLDGDIQGYMDQQASMMKHKEVMQEFRNWVAREQNGVKENTWDAWNKYVDTLPNPSPEHALAVQLKKDFKATPNDGKLDDGDYKAILADLDNQIGSLTKDSELQMIKLQQVMGQRQTAIQLVTNIMSKYGEGNSAIVANIR